MIHAAFFMQSSVVQQKLKTPENLESCQVARCKTAEMHAGPEIGWRAESTGSLTQTVRRNTRNTKSTTNKTEKHSTIGAGLKKEEKDMRKTDTTVFCTVDCKK